ncbi:prephenate dehydrogenase [Lacticaseibacillus jixiensis]|uniref:prephenate dehydrogenase n=1 Tax=Lacticaseibacillus jixiensis TaxID=3231926 RepID=UPI0036F1F1A1
MTEVFIQGLGLIGSSMARAIRQRRGDVTVVGFDADAKALAWAGAHKVVDRVAAGWADAATADVVILATPVTQIVKELAQLVDIPLKPGVIVTDTGSTKTAVMQAAQPLMAKGVTFVGGHPMAGSEKSGVKAGRAGLFAEHHYFLVNGNATPAQILALRNVLSASGMYFEMLSATQHDELVGHISHVPHVVAACLALNAAAGLAKQPEALNFAAGGFRDTTRIAASDPTMWTAVMQSNTDIIVAELDDYINQLTQARDMIAAHDEAAMYDFFAHAQAVRRSIDEQAEV